MSEDQTPPVKKKTGIGKIIAGAEKGIVSAAVFVGKEAGVIAKLFASEEPKVQADLLVASKYVQVIKTTLGKNPLVVEYLLNEIDPKVTSDELNGILTKAATALNITTEILQPTLPETIAALQAHASQLEIGSIAHNNFFTGLFNCLGILLSPGTPWGRIVAFGVYIYNTYIKAKS